MHCAHRHQRCPIIGNQVVSTTRVMRDTRRSLHNRIIRLHPAIGRQEEIERRGRGNGEALVSRRWTYSSVHCRRQSVSCCNCSSVEQSSIARHCCHPLSPFSADVLNHISSHFLIPLSDSSLICTVPAQ